jgi:hypothetical protein
MQRRELEQMVNKYHAEESRLLAPGASIGIEQFIVSPPKKAYEPPRRISRWEEDFAVRLSVASLQSSPLVTAHHSGRDRTSVI